MRIAVLGAGHIGSTAGRLWHAASEPGGSRPLTSTHAVEAWTPDEIA
jgi:predicted dinucleotide-binding enzyme